MTQCDSSLRSAALLAPLSRHVQQEQQKRLLDSMNKESAQWTKFDERAKAAGMSKTQATSAALDQSFNGIVDEVHNLRMSLATERVPNNADKY